MATKRSKTATRARKAKSKKTISKWSARVMRRSDVLDLEHGVFKKRSARQVAISMLNFEINRAGRNLSPERRRVLNGAKVELRKLFERPAI